MATLRTPLSRLMEARRAKALRDHRGVDTVEDLLLFLPRRYLDRYGDVTDLTDGAYVVVVGEVRTAAVRPMRQRRGSILTVTIRTAGRAGTTRRARCRVTAVRRPIRRPRPARPRLIPRYRRSGRPLCLRLGRLSQGSRFRMPWIPPRPP